MSLKELKINNKNAGETIEERGQFKKILSGGEKSNWDYTLAIFVTDSGVSHPVFMTAKSIKLMTPYEVVLGKNNSKKYNSMVLISLQLSQPKDNDEFKKILIRSNIGIGLTTVEKMEQKFGTDWLNKFKQDDEPFKTVLKDKQIEALRKFIDEFSDPSLNFFIAKGLERLYNSLTAELGKDNLLDKIKEIDPYSLVFNLDYEFEIIDKLATLLDLSESDLRLNALIYEAVTQISFNNNSTLVEIDNIVDFCLKDYKLYSEASIISRIKDMINKQTLYFDVETSRVSTHSMQQKEMYIAARLLSLNHTYSKTKTVAKYSTLSDLQQQAFENAINNSVSLISGFPGTGKSYVIKSIVDYFKAEKIYKIDKEVAIVAPTGRAASNIASKSGYKAKTIHSYFLIGKSDYKNNSTSSLVDSNHKVVIIDEFSMVNTDIFWLVLKKSPNLEKIILVGDNDQLPCIGQGNFIEGILDSNKIAFTKLVDIFRTDKNEIPQHFLAIKNNIEPSLQTNDVEWKDVTSLRFNDALVEIYSEKVEKFGLENVVVLVPMHKTEHGIKNINEILQRWNLFRNKDIDNKQNSISFGSGPTERTFYLGDKVVQNENDYDLDVYNGEIGYISAFSSNKDLIEVDFGYKKVNYGRS
ncbi:ATP-dependent DNA helicase, partial [Mycoplasma simbae]